MGSYADGKAEVCAWIRERFGERDEILDVGACDGCWRDLLPEYDMDAVEIFRPYAEKLKGYRRIIIGDIEGFRYEWYDLIIFGDVVEHMSTESARVVLEYAAERCADMIVAVPWEYKQGEVDGNPWQIHVQDDLTPAIFEERYPGLGVLWSNDRYAYYHKGGRG